jgi:transcriptional regulator with XRE-family HTH domain
LAADNRTGICSPCLRSDAGARLDPPAPPDSFWDTPELQEALRERHFGRLLRAYRKSQQPEIKQSDVAMWLGLTQGQVSRIERGETLANDIEKLDRWARTLGVPQRCLWFALTSQPSDTYTAGIDANNLRSTGEAEGGDVRRRQFLKTVGTSAASVGASLLGSEPTQATSTAHPGHAIGNPEVDLVREVTTAFRRVDNRYGGGHSRSAVNAYLKITVEPMLSDGRARSAVRDDLFAAAAELHQLAGWMAYDTGQADSGRRHLRTALRLCQDAEDHALSAEMLAGMSHQAAFHGVPEAAVDLALAARQTAKQAGMPLLQAEAAVMEAHGLALQRDHQGCLAALGDAESLFLSAENADMPTWLRYFDGAYLSAKFAHTFRDLGRPGEAETFARRSLEMSEGYERGRLFNTALLASVLADLGRVDEACAHGQLAVQMIGTMRSVRSAAYLADLARRLERHHAQPEVRTLYRQMIDAGIPVPSGN